MARSNRERDAALAAVYARIPPMAPPCDGRCWHACGPIDMAHRERQRIREAGVRISHYTDALASPTAFYCEALTADRRCKVYPLRPLICRLWGAIESLPCPFGCRPVGGPLSDQEGIQLLVEAFQAGGGGFDHVTPAMVAAMFRDPKVMAEWDAVLARGRAGEALRRAEPER